MCFCPSCTKTHDIDRTLEAEPEPKPIQACVPIGGPWVIPAIHHFPGQ